MTSWDISWFWESIKFWFNKAKSYVIKPKDNPNVVIRLEKEDLYEVFNTLYLNKEEGENESSDKQTSSVE